jgi:hypothetical protein
MMSHHPRSATIGDRECCMLQPDREFVRCYRVYVIDQDGHFISAVDLDCADDNAAIYQPSS